MSYRPTPSRDESFDKVRETLRKTPFLKPFYFAGFLVVCAIPLWIAGLVLAQRGEDPKSNEPLLLAATAMYGLAYFILEIIGCFLLKKKWVGCTCCVVVVLYPVRCGACCTFISWLLLLVLLVSDILGKYSGAGPFWTFLLITNFVGLVVTYII